VKRAPKPWPLVVVKLVDGFIAQAKAAGIQGRAQVYEGDAADGHFYSIVIRIHAGETVMARAHKR
jgi:hypothetical protein